MNTALADLIDRPGLAVVWRNDVERWLRDALRRATP